MINASYKINGLNELLKKFGEAKLENTINTGIKKSIIFLEGLAKKETPVDKGFLRNAYRTSFGALYGKIENTKKYAPFVHEGTAPHIIQIKNKRALSNGKNIFGKKVNHPGIKANPFITRTKEKGENQVIMILNKEILKALQT